MLVTLLTILPIVLFGHPTAAQSSSLSVVCIAGQCVQGYTNVTIGATISTTNAPTSLHLLPGAYTSTTNPQLLHNFLISPSASLSPSPGFENVSQAFKSSELPLNLDMSPGMAAYEGVRYSGQAGYSGFPDSPSEDRNDTPTSIMASSFALSDNVYVVIGSGGSSSSDDRVVFWDSVPDVAQLPFSSSSPSSGPGASLNVFDISSTTCNPVCSGNSICSPTTNSCTCPPGFTGSSCEACAPGFFGPKCQQCPGGCDQCDEGIQGTGRCLKKTIAGKPEECNCVNGQCGANGQCVCNAGWRDGDDGKKCSKCQDGFFLTSTGDCQVCQPGCLRCADTTAACAACKPGFSINSVDSTKCDAIQRQTAAGQLCPDGSFNNGNSCSSCSSTCRTCTGPTSNDCVLCASGKYLFNGNCVGTDEDGVCEGTTGMIANNLKGECDACPSKCTSCKIPGFNAVSKVDQAQCTGCLPGFVLSQGKCVESCPAGTFLSPQDNLNCISCDSSCSTCSDSASFCLTCSTSGQFAFEGKCVPSCPSNTFTSPSSSSCATCHGDCASCSGPQFNQCTSCPPNRPVLKDGRCLPTCAKGEFFDKSSGDCKSCDGSCRTCSATGEDKCLSCVDGEVLRKGKCVKSEGGCETLKGLGVCLNELVVKPEANPTANPTPVPSITGISDPTTVTVEKTQLVWWQILLMALGGAFCVLAIVVLWRRRARKRRLQRTRAWATQRGVLSGKGGTWWRRLFATRKGHHGFSNGMEKESLPRYRDDDMISELTRGKETSTVDGLIDAYADTRSSWGNRTSVTNRSLFSEITGERRRVPEPRTPMRQRTAMSMKTSSSDEEAETEAERYVRSVRSNPALVVERTETGNSVSSRNPFRRV